MKWAALGTVAEVVGAIAIVAVDQALNVRFRIPECPGRNHYRHRLCSSTVEHWTNSWRGEELEHWLGAGDLDRQCLADVDHVLVVVGQSKDHRRMGVSGVIGSVMTVGSKLCFFLKVVDLIL